MNSELRRHIMLIDPGTRRPELECFNQLALASPLPLTYHAPALFGFDSFAAEKGSAAGIVVLGSAASVNDNLPWQATMNPRLLDWMKAGIPTLGICYGHQLIAHLFGGKVDFHSADHSKQVGFREVDLDASPLTGSKPAKGLVFVSHCEVVTQVPPAFKVFGRSQEIAIDAIAHSQLPIWSFQPHPEATPSFLRETGYSPDQAIGKLKFGHTIVQGFLEFVATHKISR